MRAKRGYLSMRTADGCLLLALIGIFSGCEATAPHETYVDHQRVGLPSLPMTAASEVQPSSAGLDLVVTVALRNTLSAPVSVFTTASCAPFVSLFPYSSGTHMDLSMVCPKGSPYLSLAPGDSIRLLRRVTASELAGFSPGKYAIQAVITTSLSASGLSAGTVDLPLVAPASQSRHGAVPHALIGFSSPTPLSTPPAPRPPASSRTR
jgi:hypothetical protein